MAETYKCPECDGKGSISAGKGVYGMHFCDRCGGKGEITHLASLLSEEAKLKIKRLFKFD